MTPTALTRQQLCAQLAISESTVRRLELLGLPFTPIGARGKRYDLEEVQRWLRAMPMRAGAAPGVGAAGPGHSGEQQCPSGSTSKAGGTSASWRAADAYTACWRRAHLRVMPSS